MIKLGAKELRTVEPTLEQIAKVKRNPIYIVLDNILDTYNVGSIFRLADAVSVEKIFLCGGTETPPNHKIKKASVDTWRWVEWEYAETTIDAIKKIKRSVILGSEATPESSDNRFWTSQNDDLKIEIICVEQHPKSVPYDQFDYQFPLVIVMGHETDGVAKEVLATADAIVEIPMWGVNKSLNVTASCGIVLYEVMKRF